MSVRCTGMLLSFIMGCYIGLVIKEKLLHIILKLSLKLEKLEQRLKKSCPWPATTCIQIHLLAQNYITATTVSRLTSVEIQLHSLK